MSKFSFTINSAALARKAPQKTPTKPFAAKHTKSYLSNCIFKALKTGDREMKYPSIYQSTANGNVILLLNDKQGVVLDKCETIIGTSGKWNEFTFKNITTEYLANTYGEVKNKEHAEFIVRLCENAGIEVFPQLFDANHFVIKGKLSFHNCERITSSELKQITIPLPPECDSVDECPKVGSKVTWGTKAVNGEIKGIDGDLAWIRNDHGNYNTVHIIDLEKPKTPEQELRDEISDLAFNQFNDDSYDLTHNSYYFAEQLISKYNINKKPQ